MRVCPKCGHIDPPQWKHCKYSYYIDGITRENFEKLYPDLAKNLKKGRDLTEDELYVYRLTKTELVVERKAKIDFLSLSPIDWKDGHEKGSRQLREPHALRKHWFITPKNLAKSQENPKHWSKLHPSQKKLLETI